MYTKEDMRELMRQFEGMVRGLNTRFSEEDIIKLVSLIVNNHLQDGQFTEEYLQYSKMALGMRKQMGEDLTPAQNIILSGFQPRQKKL